LDLLCLSTTEENFTVRGKLLPLGSSWESSRCCSRASGAGVYRMLPVSPGSRQTEQQTHTRLPPVPQSLEPEVAVEAQQERLTASRAPQEPSCHSSSCSSVNADSLNLNCCTQANGAQLPILPHQIASRISRQHCNLPFSKEQTGILSNPCFPV